MNTGYVIDVLQSVRDVFWSESQCKSGLRHYRLQVTTWQNNG